MQADLDNIDYGEFIAATLYLTKIQRVDHLFAAFSYFDKDGSGYITQDELQQACKEFGIVDFPFGRNDPRSWQKQCKCSTRINIFVVGCIWMLDRYVDGKENTGKAIIKRDLASHVFLDLPSLSLPPQIPRKIQDWNTASLERQGKSGKSFFSHGWPGFCIISGERCKLRNLNLSSAVKNENL